ncbi:hypothetical protein BKA66DRAFT_572389 [Pyrenochaeta sp. MPI-SDFR-AT-0127]|nr:hypothetical protein BKA66DRAFT_572389 [Pyrenochaeta sp. MPI-SDFR-AT-0127]
MTRGRVHDERTQLSDRGNGIASSSTWSMSDTLSQNLPPPDWPPSIREAVDRAYNAPSRMLRTQNAAPMDHGYPHEMQHTTIPNTPLSFYGRSRDCALPQMHYTIDAFYDDPETSTYFVPSDYTHLPGFASNIDSADFRTTRSSSSQESVYAYAQGPLQYHLIETKTPSMVDISHGQITPRSSQSSQPTSNVGDVRTLDCPLCHNPYTGQYAQRNLHRHMESKHSSRASSDGAKHIRCNVEGCRSTFGRDDALLLHTRRSHPETNPPQAKKRKRTDEAS